MSSDAQYNYMSARQIESELIEHIAHFWNDPLGFVIFAYPWTTDPSLQLVKLPDQYQHRFNCEFGPDLWACEFLDDIGQQVRKNNFDGLNAVPPLRYAISSGHGIGKSTVTAWLVHWIMSTRPGAKGTVTANTSSQLETKTWEEVAKLVKRGIN